jgi:hypothetical protein
MMDELVSYVFMLLLLEILLAVLSDFLAEQQAVWYTCMTGRTDQKMEESDAKKRGEERKRQCLESYKGILISFTLVY